MATQIVVANGYRYIWIFLVIMLAQAWPALGQESRRQIVIEENADYFGFDLLTEKDVSLEQCKSSCLDNPGCVAFTYNLTAQFCFLKSDFGELKPFTGAIAGRVVKIDAHVDIGAPPKLSFVAEYLIENARKYRASIAARQIPTANPGFAGLKQSARQQSGKAAISSIEAALRIDSKDQESWLILSDIAHRSNSTNSGGNRLMRDIATSAALNGYLLSRSKSSRAAALAHLARALQASRNYRAALSAYEMSLELDEAPIERSAFLELRRTHGFRILDHTVDSDSHNPRICFQFSEDLKAASAGYEDYLSVDSGVPQAIDVKKRQICIEGLQHGNRYKITLRKGLPSKLTEALQADVDQDIYVRDRRPAVRFTGSNFVLPATARRGIPLITVNTDNANLKIFRVGERALAPLLRDSQFLRQLGSYQVEYLVGDLGEPVWSGSLSIKPELNKEVTTSIPIDEALPRRKPGIYFLTATPAASGPNDADTRATQWFVISDIGLTTFSGSGDMRVLTRHLSSAKSMAGVEVALIARNNEVLGTGQTNDRGEAIFDAGLLRGKGGLAPAFITAKKGAEDFVFLDLTKSAFDFSDRGVTGREVAKGVDIYAWSERGIYRAGETVHVAALARDGSARAIDDLPLTFVFSRPDGVEERRIVASGADLGGYAVELPLTPIAKRGTWQVQVFTDPKSEPVAEQRFLVEDFLPERTDFSLLPAQEFLEIGQPGIIKVKGRYLYGAPAAGLTLEGEMVIRTKTSRKNYPGYMFGLTQNGQGSAQRFAVNNISHLDAAGETSFEILLDKIRQTTRMQTAELVVRMREGSGRAVERRVDIDVVPQHTMIGIKPQFESGQITENSTAGFDIIAVDQGGIQTNLEDAAWSLVKIERNYQWYRSGYSWNYESVDLETKIADGIIDIKAETLAQISAPVEWGRYRLEIETASASGPATSVEFNAGWYVQSQSIDTPDGLEIALDKSSYKSGEIARLNVSPRFAGEMLIAIGTDRIVEIRTVSIPAQGATIDIEVGDDWGAGAYVLATLYRPGDAVITRNPMRSIGVKWLGVDPRERALNVSLEVPGDNRPHETLSIPVTVSGLNSGEEAYVMVAAVDVGILNLTNYQSPDPVERYFGQRKLGVQMRDIYGRLIDGSLGAAGRLRTGGDTSGELSSDGSAPTQKLIAFFSGPIRLDSDGNAQVDFDIPQFNGTVRIMVTAWSARGVGAASADTIIRDPVVITASLPKFLAPGDETRLLVEFANADGPSGEFDVAYEFSETLALRAPGDENPAKTIELASGAHASLHIPVKAVSRGQGWARIELSRSDGFLASHEISIDIRPGQLPVTRKLKVPLLANGGSLLVDKILLEGSRLEGAKINISAALENSIDVPSLLLQLSQYPYGCAEQITSKALPLLYVGEFPDNIPGFDNEAIKEKIQTAINRVLSYQSTSGGFGLWGNGVDDMWLGAYVTDFLTRAVEKGYNVPAQSLKSALQNLQNVLAYQNNVEENDAAIAYSLYVLARNRLASAGDLRYYGDTQLGSFKTPIARAQLAAGMALYGDQQRAESTFDAALQLARSNASATSQRYTYGSSLRDAAAMLALAGESRPAPSNLSGMKRLVASLARTDIHTSTQEQAWMLLAARAARASNENIALNVNGLPHSGPYSRQMEGAELVNEPVRLTNRNSQDLEAIITSVASPAEIPPAGGDGFTIERTYYSLNGLQSDIARVTQNQRFVVVINFHQLNDFPSRLIVTDLLPAGFEIDNPGIVKSADLKNFNWLPKTIPAHSEFRDDRFVSAFNRPKGGQSKFTVAYIVRAVTPGEFMHPAATVEDMYRPQLSARTAAGWMRVEPPI